MGKIMCYSDILKHFSWMLRVWGMHKAVRNMFPCIIGIPRGGTEPDNYDLLEHTCEWSMRNDRSYGICCLKLFSAIACVFNS